MNNALSAEFEKRYPAGSSIRARFIRDTDRFSVTVLFGPSGCGKTTVLRCLAGLARPEQGRISFAGETWFDADAGVFLPPQRRNIGLLCQSYALFPHLTLAENVSFGLRRLSRLDRRKRIGELLRLMGLVGLEHRYPHQLSGGQQQRAALARAVAPRPRILLLDEPLSALDAPTREQLRCDLRHLLIELGTLSFIVTHDRIEAMALADHVIVMDQGTIRQDAPVVDVFCRPADISVARMVGVETVHPARVLTSEQGLARLAVGSAELTAVADPPVFGEVFVSIRAEDVILQEAVHARLSAQNQLRGQVRQLVREGPMVRVTLDCGFPLVALVTSHAIAELGVAVGLELSAVVKAPAIHLIRRGQ